jgi:hypothetical protein
MGHAGEEPKIIGGTDSYHIFLRPTFQGEISGEKTHQLWHKKGSPPVKRLKWHEMAIES